LPAHGGADATLFAVDHHLQTRLAECYCVFAHFNAYPATSHFVGDCGGGAAAKEAVEHEVAGVAVNLEDALKQFFGFWGSKGLNFG
jgi:hypothetical protein